MEDQLLHTLIAAGEMCRNPGRIGIRFTLFWLIFVASVIMPGAGEDGDGACEAMVQPTDGLVFERELATLTVAVTRGCCMDKDPEQVTRISLELKGAMPSRAVISLAWSIATHVLLDQGLDIDLPGWLPDDEYRGDLLIETPQQISRRVHFWRISMTDPAIKVLFPVPGFAFGRDSRPWVQILVTDKAQEVMGIREVRYSVAMTDQNGISLGIRNSTNGNKIHVVLPQGLHHVTFQVHDIMGRLTDARASTTVNVSASERDVVPPRSTLVASKRGSECPASDACESQDGCSGHGSCVSGACLCTGDYAGELCDTWLLESREYLPVVDPRTSASRCLKARHLASFTSDILSRQTAVQRPSRCDPATIFLQSRSSRGLGLTLRWLGLAMSQAIVDSKALVVGGRQWSWFEFEGCSDGMGCYLEPGSNCTEDDVWRRPSGANLTHLEEQGRDHVEKVWRKGGLVDVGGRERIVSSLNVMDGHVPTMLQVPEEALGGGILWWTANTLAQVVRPGERLRALVRAAMNDLGWIQPTIGVHVRRGDSCADWSRPSPCLPLADYTKACQDMAERYKVRAVFIATDSAEVAEEARRELPGLHVMSLAGHVKDVFDSDLFIEFRMQMALTDRRAVTESTLIDLMLLSQADYFVGTFSSAFSSVAFELSVESKGFVPPFISLDTSWKPFLPFEPHPTVSMQNRVRTS